MRCKTPTLSEKWKERHQDAHEVSNLNRDGSAQHHRLIITHPNERLLFTILYSHPFMRRPMIMTSTSIKLSVPPWSDREDEVIKTYQGR
jgi:hypothetical protein